MRWIRPYLIACDKSVSLDFHSSPAVCCVYVCVLTGWWETGMMTSGAVNLSVYSVGADAIGGGGGGAKKHEAWVRWPTSTQCRNFYRIPEIQFSVLLLVKHFISVDMSMSELTFNAELLVQVSNSYPASGDGEGLALTGDRPLRSSDIFYFVLLNFRYIFFLSSDKKSRHVLLGHCMGGRGESASWATKCNWDRSEAWGLAGGGGER